MHNYENINTIIVFNCMLITGRNEVVAKVMFLQVCVCPQGGCLPQCMLGCHTPPGPGRHPPRTRQTPLPLDQVDTPRDQADPPGTRQTPPDQGDTPWDQADPPGPGRPPGTRQSPPQTRETPLGPGRPPSPPDQADTSPGSRLQHTVYELPVRILLECILVIFNFITSLK